MVISDYYIVRSPERASYDLAFKTINKNPNPLYHRISFFFFFFCKYEKALLMYSPYVISIIQNAIGHSQI